MEWWQWFIDIIGLVAFLMAIPALLYIWGKPKIRITYDCTSGYRLMCWIRNMPVNRALSSLNIVRTQIQVSPIVSIIDNGGTVLHLLHYAQSISDDIRLAIAEVTQSSNGIVYLKDEIGNNTNQSLGIGSYNIIVTLHGIDGRELKKKEALLRINHTNPYIEVITE